MRSRRRYAFVTNFAPGGWLAFRACDARAQLGPQRRRRRLRVDQTVLLTERLVQQHKPAVRIIGFIADNVRRSEMSRMWGRGGRGDGFPSASRCPQQPLKSHKYHRPGSAPLQTQSTSREGEMDLEFAGFVALAFAVAGLSAPIAGIKVTGARLHEIAAAVAAAHCVVTADDEASYYLSGPGQGLIPLVPDRRDGIAYCGAAALPPDASNPAVSARNAPQSH
jgi:hypothetical protein